MQAKRVQLPLQQVAYYESAGSGHPIILVHGNSCSGSSYQHQINSPLGEKYRLVAIDLPGHGLSDPAPDPAAYNLPGYAHIVAAVAQALDMPDALLAGWSLGGHIVLEAHNLLPTAAGFLIFGTPPLAFPPAMEAAFLPNPAVAIGFKPDVSEDEAQAYAASFFAPRASVDLASFVADILGTDGRARAGLGASITPDGYQDEVEIVANLARPLAVLHGEHEQLVNDAYISDLTMPTLWRNAVQMISEAGHAPHWEQPQQFNALLAAFVEDAK